MEKRKSKIERLEESINEIIDGYDEPGIIIFNPKTYKKIHKEFGKQGLLIHHSSILGIPWIVENIKEDCLVLSKSTIELIKKSIK